MAVNVSQLALILDQPLRGLFAFLLLVSTQSVEGRLGVKPQDLSFLMDAEGKCRNGCSYEVSENIHIRLHINLYIKLLMIFIDIHQGHIHIKLF